tara:strand:- start:1050 stop:1688 length:639 start_codon:yes stop_codon:yes gene_type:complete
MTLTFNQMLNEIQRDERLDPIPLVVQWDGSLRDQINGLFSDIWENLDATDLEISLEPGLSNQARGTRLWKRFRPTLIEGLTDARFETCLKSGYPDRKLVLGTGESIAFEEKAHSKWDPNDGNRVVICSSTRRLRETFSQPIFHLWATLYHSIRNTENETICTIHQLRLHYVEPETLVARRLETSTSNKLLRESVVQERHVSISFGELPDSDV